jgi:PAS domain S-box-containing protein
VNRNLRILLIEDNPGDADLIEEMLDEADLRFDLCRAERLSSGIDQIRVDGFDVILLDLGLPDSQGINTLLALNVHKPGAPIIVLTGLADEAVGTRAVTEGAQDYLIKGQIDKNQLTRSIRYAIERKKAEEKIQTAAREWSASFDAMSDVVSIHTLDNTILAANQAIYQLLGKCAAEVIGKKCQQMFHGKLCPIADCPAETTRATNQRAYAEIFEPTLNKWLAVSASPVLDDSGCLVRIVHTVRDVTERRKVAEELKFRNVLLSTQMEVALDGVLVVDENARITSYNRRFIELFGIPVDLVADQVEEPVLHFATTQMANPEAFLQRVRYLTEHRQETSQDELILADGRVFDRYSAPMFGTGEHYFGRVWYFRDITSRKQAEQKIQHQLSKIRALRTIDVAISGSLDLHFSLEVLLQQTLKLLSIDAAAILLFNEQTQTLEYAAGLGFNTDIVELSRVHIQEGFAGRVAAQRKPLIIPTIPDIMAEPAPSRLIHGEGFKAYVGIPLIAKGQFEGVLELFHHTPLAPDSEWLEFAEALAGQAAIALDNAGLFDKLQRSHRDLLLAYDTTIEGWSRALDYRDKETEGHSQRVASQSVKIARMMGMSNEELVHVRRGALLHDIGKLGVPDHILLKPGALSDEEFAIMKQHPVIAFSILSPIAFLRLALDIPYCHHEKWDGTGYPRGLKGDQIPLAARIFAVVDVWDALRSNRPYRQGWPDEQIREFLRAESGSHFDPAVIELFLPIIPE